METNKRTNRVNRKKKRIILIFFIVLFTLILGILSFSFWEYKHALKNSETSIDNNSKKKIEFNGVKDKFGNINILLIGIDSRGEKHSRADTIMIAQYDQDTKKSKLVSIMRDSYIEIPGHEKNKINAAHAFGGPELLRKTIKENFGIDVQYYALIDFKGFSKTIDAAFPKGIKVNVEKEMSEGIGVKLNPGVQKLHGKELLGYVRFRKDALSDFGRVERQQEVLKTVANNVVSFTGLTKLPRMIGTVQPYIETNIKSSLILSVISSFISEDNRDIESLRIPVKDGYTDASYVIDGYNSAVLELDLEKNRMVLDEFLSVTGK